MLPGRFGDQAIAVIAGTLHHDRFIALISRYQVTEEKGRPWQPMPSFIVIKSSWPTVLALLR